MSIFQDGIDAEKKARLFLKAKGYNNLQQLDWLVKHDNVYFAIEVKHRELYQPPPFLGTGLDVYQIKYRMQIYKDLNIKTLLLVFEKDTENIYYKFLDELEKTKYFNTKNGIRIYNINEFNREIKDIGIAKAIEQ